MKSLQTRPFPEKKIGHNTKTGKNVKDRMKKG